VLKLNVDAEKVLIFGHLTAALVAVQLLSMTSLCFITDD